MSDCATQTDEGDTEHQSIIGHNIARDIGDRIMQGTNTSTKDIFKIIIQMPREEGAWMINNMAKTKTRRAVVKLWLCDG